jgi:acid phosphatase type 7
MKGKKLIFTLFALLFMSLPAQEKKETQAKKEAPKPEVQESEEEKKEVIAITSRLTRLTGTNPAQWRVIWTGDASREATVSWTTAEKGKSHKVYLSTNTPGLDLAKYELVMESSNNGLYTLDKKEKDVTSAYYHHASIKGLKPATKYNFLIVSDGQVSKPLYFITAPEKGTGFSIIHGGDSRSGHLARCKVNMLIAKLTESAPEIIGFAHGGDYIVSGRSYQQWRLWLSHHELTTGKDGRVLPIIPTRGNHDTGILYKEVFNIAPKQADWHTTTIGSDVAIVTLDTNVAAGGPQVEWLEDQLKELRPKTKWLLTQYHRPLYPAVKTPAPHTKQFCALFDQYEVDLACEADGHCIKRTVPIKDGKEDPTGTVYIGEGGLGVGQRAPNKELWYIKGGVAGMDHHIMLLNFKSTTLNIKTILLSEGIFDDHYLQIRSK